MVEISLKFQFMGDTREKRQRSTISSDFVRRDLLSTAMLSESTKSKIGSNQIPFFYLGIELGWTTLILYIEYMHSSSNNICLIIA